MKMNANESVLAIALMAAVADGGKDANERDELKKIADNLELENSALIYQNVIMRKVGLADAVESLDSKELKMFAYEMAVCVCDADDKINEKEKIFLDDLRTTLDLESDQTEAVEKNAEELILAEPESDQTEESALVDESEINRMILNYSILNGALELLPQNLATLAIIPLQTKMVYRIGKKYGYNLDSGHIKEFIATAGVGLTSQMVEGFARKFIGGFGKKLFGKTGKKVAGTATGAIFSFASTYGLGKVAVSYYSGGRKLSMDAVRVQFDRFKNEGTQLYDKYRGDVQSRASNLSMSEIMPMIRGNKI
jgi:uncharacterized protein (DUF697 family)/tellurite resistance protein